MKIRIGKYEVYNNYSLLMQPGEAAVVPLFIDNWNLEVELTFHKKTDVPSESATVEIVGVSPNRAAIKLFNWDNALGTSMNIPQHLGKSGLNKVDIYFILAHWKVGLLDKVDLQIMTGANHG